MTGASGAFRFDALEPGQYSVSAQKPEFTLPANADFHLLSFRLTASVEGLRIMLSPLGVITGKASDQDGQPLAHVNMIAISTHIQDGALKMNTERTVSTDDRGIYRLWNLRPGKYYIKAAGRSGGTNTYVGDVPPWYASDDAFAPVYSGGSRTLDAATPVLITPGAEAHADVSLRLEPAYKIRGVVSNLAPGPAAKFELLTGDEDVSSSRVSVNANTGRFEIQDVVSGSYVLRVTQGAAVAEVPVKVAGADADGIQATLAPAVDIHVTARFVGAQPEESEGPAIGVCMVTLHSAARRISTTYAMNAPPRSQRGGPPQRGGEAAIPGVLPGTYRVAVNCFGGYPSSVLFGTQDILANSAIAVPPGVQPPSMDIVANYGGGAVVGVLKLSGRIDGQMTGVLLVPQFPESVGPLTALAAPNEDGDAEFVFSGLAPGAYTAYAFSNLNAEEYRNPDFLGSLTGGVAVQVTNEGESKITLTGVVR